MRTECIGKRGETVKKKKAGFGWIDMTGALAWNDSGRKYACKESIAYLWDRYVLNGRKGPSTLSLFEAIAGEAVSCLSHSDWDARINRIENILSVVKHRMQRYWDEWHMSELDKLVSKKRGDLNDVEKDN
jgi:hypothetical protein